MKIKTPIKLVACGKIKMDGARELASLYQTRISKYAKLELLELKPKEYETFLNGLLSEKNPDRKVFLLEESGEDPTSREFAEILEEESEKTSELCFLIGPAEGHSPEVLDKFKSHLSLSALTFPNQLVRVIFLEQLYRALTLIHGHPYHND